MKRAIALALVLALAPCVRADSLGAAAKREEERRIKVEEAGQGASHVISEEELAANKGRTATDVGASPAVPADSSSEGKPRPLSRIPSRGKDGGSDAASWASRAAALEADVKAAERALETAKAAPLSTAATRTLVVDPGGHILGTQDSAPRYADAREEHDRMVAEAQRRLDAARGALATLEDDARRQAIPPGWLRGQR